MMETIPTTFKYMIPTNFIKNMVKLCKNNKIRHLPSIRIFSDEKSCKIVSTSGNIMVMALIGEGIVDKNLQYDFMFNADSLNSLKSSNDHITLNIIDSKNAYFLDVNGNKYFNNDVTPNISQKSILNICKTVKCINYHEKVDQCNPHDLVLINNILNTYSSINKTKDLNMVLYNGGEGKTVAKSTKTNNVFAIIGSKYKNKIEDNYVDWL